MLGILEAKLYYYVCKKKKKKRQKCGFFLILFCDKNVIVAGEAISERIAFMYYDFIDDFFNKCHR
jgi:hypothetical protein